jgi:hypothetical protein
VRAFLTEPTSAAAVGHKATAKSEGKKRNRTQQRTYRCFDETHCAMRVRRSINTVFSPLLLCAGIELSIIIIIIISYSGSSRARFALPTRNPAASLNGMADPATEEEE